MKPSFYLIRFVCLLKILKNHQLKPQSLPCLSSRTSEFHFALPTTTNTFDDHKVCSEGAQEDPLISQTILFLWNKPLLNTQMQETLLCTREVTGVPQPCRGQLGLVLCFLQFPLVIRGQGLQDDELHVPGSKVGWTLPSGGNCARITQGKREEGVGAEKRADRWKEGSL